MNVVASGGSFLVSPNVGLMVWTLVVFGATLIFLWKFVFPRISEALDRRQHAIEESIDHAERVTRKTLTPADQRRLVEDALRELDFSALSGGAN